MPVGFANKAQTRRIRFTTGVFHDGKDYGPKPDFKDQEADVDAASALSYVQQGRAIYADVDGGADGEIIPDEETVIGTGSSIRAVVGGGAINVDPESGRNVTGLDTKSAGAAVKNKDKGK